MTKFFLLLALGLLSPSLAIKCYRDLEGEPTDCTTSGDVVDTVQSKAGSVWKWFKDGVQKITGDDWIDDFGETIKNSIGVDITSHEKNKAWVQKTLNNIGLNVDVSGNCYVTFDKTSREKTLERGCGALGKAGTLSAELVGFMQGRRFNFWANSVCFTKPGSADKEVCMCSKDNCNKDYSSAMTAAGINPQAKAAECGGEECPLADLSKVDPALDFNSACYTYTGPGETNSQERCFTTDVVALPEAAKLTRDRRSIDDQDGGNFKLTNVDGQDKAFEGEQAAFQSIESGGNQKTVSFGLFFLLAGLFALHFM